MSEEITMTSTIVTSTITVTTTEPAEVPVEQMAVLMLRKPKNYKKVVWTTDTVDNEEMNKKKSKCCCVFHKKVPFGESDSEDSDDECEHCQGHVEKKKERSTQNISVHPDVAESSGIHDAQDIVPMETDHMEGNMENFSDNLNTVKQHLES